MRLRDADAGQATVETVGLLPLLVAVALGVGHLMAAGVAHELADHAAEAGAVALLQGSDPEDAAREALPGWAKERVAVSVQGHRVRVRVVPPALIASVGEALDSTAQADAGAGSG